MANGGIIGPTTTPTLGNLITQFTSPGTFNRGVPQGDVLVVSGGGGNWINASGAGAGGVIYTPAHPLPASGVPVVVGAGGTGVPSNPYAPAQGGNSQFGAASPIGTTGGGGGSNDGNYAGQPGGSGAGATYGPSGTQTTTGSGIGGQGNAGGNGYRLAPQFGNRGGGGGKGGAGGAAPSGPDGSPGGNGGAGSDYSPTYGTQYGENGVFGGGGAGSNSRGNGAATGGTGGGGDAPTSDPGSSTGPEFGIANTGGGAGSNPNYPQAASINGGSGVVLIKEANVLQNTSGVWSMAELLLNVEAGTWSS